LGLGICTDCGLLQQKYDDANEFLSEVVYRDYQATYSVSQRVSEYLTAFAKNAITRAKARQRDIVVEIGCNDGGLLSELGRQQLRTVGYEPSLSFSKALARSGIDVIPEYFSLKTSETYLGAYPKACLVISRHMLEHAFDPLDFLLAMAAILDKDGLVVIEVPYLVSQVANNHYSSMTFQHIMIFSVTSLCRVLERANLTAIHVDFVETDGGSMVLYASHRGERPTTSGIDHIQLLEQSLQYHVADGLIPFFQGVERQRREVGPLLTNLQKTGECVAAYGAGGKGQGLINILHCDVGQIRFAVDSTVQERRFIPGTKIPVIPREHPLASEATLFFVTAPTHGREIVEKERGKHGSKDKFLLISPHLHFQ